MDTYLPSSASVFQATLSTCDAHELTSSAVYRSSLPWHVITCLMKSLFPVQCYWKEFSITWGSGRKWEIPSWGHGSCCFQRGGNSLTILPRPGSPYEEQCQGGSEKLCDDIRVWGLRRLPAPSYSGTSKEPFSQAQTTSPQSQHVSQKRVIPHQPVQKCTSSTTSRVTHPQSTAQKGIVCVDAPLSAHSISPS